MNASSGNNLMLNQVSKPSPPMSKNILKEQKFFSSGKSIDPAWLAQTKMETANMANANKLLVSNFELRRIPKLVTRFKLSLVAL